MSYKYEEIKPRLFTPDGMEMFISIRDNVKHLLKQAGAIRMDAAMRGQTGDSWIAIACVDLMVERGELIEIKQADCVGQHRVFVERN